MKRLLLIVALAAAVLAVVALPASAGKYAPTLVATPSTVAEGEYFNLSGCGYDDRQIELSTQYVGVWKVYADSNGCFSFDFAQATGANGFGEQNVYARQQSGKSLPKVVAQTTITVTP